MDSLTATAEEGATGGAQLDVSSPSGTNRLHGAAFRVLAQQSFSRDEPAWVSNGENQQPLRRISSVDRWAAPSSAIRRSSFFDAESYRQRWGPGKRRRPERVAHCNRSDLIANLSDHHGIPRSRSDAILTPWTPITDLGDQYYMIMTCYLRLPSGGQREFGDAAPQTSISRQPPRGLCDSSCLVAPRHAPPCRAAPSLCDFVALRQFPNRQFNDGSLRQSKHPSESA